jgi:hypothetical protein
MSVSCHKQALARNRGRHQAMLIARSKRCGGRNRHIVPEPRDLQGPGAAPFDRTDGTRCLSDWRGIPAATAREWASEWLNVGIGNEFRPHRDIARYASLERFAC